MFTHSRLVCASAHERHLEQADWRLGKRAWLASWLIAAATVMSWQTAAAHGIAGNRLFPGTLSFDDPAVSDEFAFTPSWVDRRALDGSAVTDGSVSWEFTRLLFPTVAVVVDSGFTHRYWTELQRNGFDTTTVSLKGLLYESDPHEVLVSAELGWGIGGSGSPSVGTSQPNTVRPALYFGKGFGDLPDRLSWLRPFAITGAFAAEIPTVAHSTILGVSSASPELVPVPYQDVPTLHWDFSLQYSTYYLTPRYTGGPAKEEPLNQFVPLVEFTFDTPRGQKTIANPGVAYAANTWQFAVEAVVPLDSVAGHGVGVRTQLLLFLDDLVPSVFGKPLLGW